MSVRSRRHRAREVALQTLYQWDVGRVDVEQAIATFFDQQWRDAGPPADDLRAFATALVRETVARLDAIDQLIAATAERWRPERMAIVDRLILRVAVCELMGPDTPPAVVIDEALELALTVSTEDAVKFINGMLDAIRKKLDAQH